jgi:hypothetical protein
MGYILVALVAGIFFMVCFGSAIDAAGTYYGSKKK